MKKTTLTIALLISALFGALAQTSSENWNTLSKLEYSKSTDEYGEIYVPKFGPSIQALEGTEIELSGYIIPFEGMFEPDHLIISSVPVASCFFCGGAGPESVAEVYLKEPVKYTAKKVTVKGTLALNDSDVDQLMYILKDATLKTN
ncbi:hypothetical protein [Marinoscillum furvescens]|uniref:DUF3299 domain-containing protein n=1 Tax=Marinoscillum furvescens DSM 4134 TaxID=1122208 RepID=A0A3D9L321_MARFU|nr:hypothetical protein [Marinoscillum furvescens]RED99433.1 hypothetical protein C7460_10849 [Marinoscillum furvescens DSM 4134]